MTCVPLHGDHARLKEVLSGIKGKFILTYNDDPFIRKLYSGYIIDEIERNHNLRLNMKRANTLRLTILCYYVLVVYSIAVKSGGVE